MSNTADESTRETRFNEILAAYLQARERGEAPPRGEFTERYPEFASDFAAFFADQDRFQAAAGPIKFAAGSVEPTQGAVGAPLLPTGQRVRYFGDYEVIEEIARGGMGVVYRARQVNLKRTVALKMVLAGQLATPADIQRFYAEAEAAAKLAHPNIVPIFEVGQHEHQHYFSMAFVDGESLARRVAQGVLESREAARLMKDVSSAIAYAHVEGVIHRDLKPGNILIDKDGTPRVTDFGLAKRVEGEASGLTMTGQVLGTPSYMPPEQASADSANITQRSDVYSLGAVLYCLVTGRPPFQAANPVETLIQVMTREPVSPRLLNAAVPRDLETIILKCLEKEPARRYQSAQELVDELARFLAGKPILARPLSWPERSWRWCRRNPVTATLTAGIAASLMIGTIVSSYFAISDRNRAVEAMWERDRAEANSLLAREHSARAEQKTIEAESSAAAARTEKARADEKAAEAAAAALAIQAEKLTADKNLYVAHMNLVQRAWEESNLIRIHNLLDRQRPPDARDLIVTLVRPRTALARTESDLRGFEWYYWQQRMNSQLLNLHDSLVPVAHAPGAWAVAFSPDGQGIATGGGDAFVKIWNAADGRLLHTLRGHKDRVECVAYSADSKRIASTGGAFDGVKVWDAESGKQVFTFVVRTGDTTSVPTGVAFRPDGQQLAVAAYDKEIKLWDLASGKELPSLKGHTDTIQSVAFSPDGRYLASGSNDRTVKIWNADDGQLVHTLRGHTERIYKVNFSPDSKLLAAADWHGVVRLWDVAGGKEANVLKASATYLWTLDFSPDGKRLATAGQDEAVRLWELPSGENSLTLRGHVSPVYGVSFSPDGVRIASASIDGRVKIWDATSGQEAPLLRGEKNKEGLICVALSRDGKRIAAAGFGGAIEVWNAQTLKREQTLQDGVAAVRCLAFSPDDKWIIDGGDNRKIRIWDLATGKVKAVLGSHQREVTSLAVSADGKLLASSGGLIFHTPDKDEGAEVKLWNLAEEKELASFRDHRVSVTAVAIRADGQQLASASGSGVAVIVRDLSQGKVIHSLQAHTKQITSLAYSPDGKLLATASYDKTVKLWDSTTGKELRTLAGHAERIQSVVFSPDGKRLATASQDKTVKVWDVATGQETLSLKGHSHFVNQVAFSADGRRLVSASHDATVRIWDATPIASATDLGN